jgi:hypothetical protein
MLESKFPKLKVHWRLFDDKGHAWDYDNELGLYLPL